MGRFSDRRHSKKQLENVIMDIYNEMYNSRADEDREAMQNVRLQALEREVADLKQQLKTLIRDNLIVGMPKVIKTDPYTPSNPHDEQYKQVKKANPNCNCKNHG